MPLGPRSVGIDEGNLTRFQGRQGFLSRRAYSGGLHKGLEYGGHFDPGRGFGVSASACDGGCLPNQRGIGAFWLPKTVAHAPLLLRHDPGKVGIFGRPSGCRSAGGTRPSRPRLGASMADWWQILKPLGARRRRVWLERAFRTLFETATGTPAARSMAWRPMGGGGSQSLARETSYALDAVLKLRRTEPCAARIASSGGRTRT